VTSQDIRNNKSVYFNFRYYFLNTLKYETFPILPKSEMELLGLEDFMFAHIPYWSA